MATTYGSKSLFDVKDEIDRYYDDLYSGLIDGVFLDEFSNDLARVGYYQEIRDYVKGKDANALVIGNPGTSFTNNPSGQTTYTVDDYARSMDVITTFENTGSAYATNYTPPSWVNDFGADRFAHIIHSQSAWTATLLATISARKAGMVYVTDDGSPNPYDQFASYWTTEVKALSDHNDSERSVVSYTATDDLFPIPSAGSTATPKLTPRSTRFLMGALFSATVRPRMSRLFCGCFIWKDLSAAPSLRRIWTTCRLISTPCEVPV